MIDGSAVQKISDLAQEAQEAEPKITQVGGIPFSTVPMHDLRKKDPEPDTLTVHTLSGFADYIAANRDDLTLDECIIHVVGPTRVDLRSKLLGTFEQRLTYVTAQVRPPITASALGFAFSRWLDKESLNIAIQSLFVDAFDRATVLKLIGTVTAEATAATKDDGVTQSVNVKAGLALVGSAEVPNPVVLAPYRTFSEIHQPSSPFVLRLRQNDGVEAALFEADGGAWEQEAIKRIASYLEEEISGVTIIA